MAKKVARKMKCSETMRLSFAVHASGSTVLGYSGSSYVMFDSPQQAARYLRETADMIESSHSAGEKP